MDEKGFKEGQFIGVTLSQGGANSFRFLKNGEEGQRELYFIDRIEKGCITGATMLLGQFVFEFESAPKCALALTPGDTNRLYFPRDKRVDSYHEITELEKEEVKRRLCALQEEKPEHRDQIAVLIEKI